MLLYAGFLPYPGHAKCQNGINKFEMVHIVHLEACSIYASSSMEMLDFLHMDFSSLL